LEKLGVSVKGKIALIRYGRIFRGDKIKLAQANGASAAILFSDPLDCAPDGMDDGLCFKIVYVLRLYFKHMSTQTPITCLASEYNAAP
jgi:hypothetical protein